MKRKIKVTATVAFTDALTGKDYKPGDEVQGWDRQRVALYQMRGMVECRVESELPIPTPEEIKPTGPSESKDADA